MVAAIIGGVLTAGSIGLNLAGGARKDAAEREAVQRQYQSDMRNWRYQTREQKRRYKYDTRGLDILRENNELELQYNEETARRDYGYKLAIQDYEYRNAMRQYDQSEKNYKQQLSFNNIAAVRAYEAERQKLREVDISQAFQNQDLVIESLQEDGKARLVQSGRSAGKAAQSSLASYGRNVAILEESLKSAKRQHMTNLKKIDLEKLGADLAAEAARMIKPERLPEIPAPLALPRPTYQKVFKPGKIPKPIKGAAAGGAFTGAVGDSVATLGALNWGSAFPKGGGFNFGGLFT